MAAGDHTGPAPPPGTVTVVGAAEVGRGIASALLLADAEVRLVDVDADQLESAVHRILADVEVAVDRGELDAEVADRAQSRLATSTDLAVGAEGADVVIEAVAQRVDVKHEVLRAAEQHVAADALLVTSTAAMSVTEVIAALDDPSRGVGMHFVDPGPRLRLCEIIRGMQTAAATVARAEVTAHAMGSRTIRVEDIPGLATARLNALVGNEAMRMLEEGVASAEDIDTAVRLGLNHPVGPLELGDQVGWDTRLEVLTYLESTLGERFRPTNLHRRMVAAGHIGRRSGQGIYRHDAP